MKQPLLIALALIAVGLPGAMIHAQGNNALKQELNQEIDLLLPKVRLHKKARAKTQGIVLADNLAPSATAVAPSAPAVAAPSTTVQSTNTNGNANENTATAGTSTNVNVQVTDTPAQTVEATPLKESKLEKLRKNRQDMERSTEEKLVEKLESDRIAREQKRSDKTEAISFDEEKKAEAEMNKMVDIKQTQVKETTTVTAIQAQDAVIVPAAKPEPKIEAKIEKVEEQREERQQWYVGANAGMGDYAAQNVKGIYAAGLLVGVALPERIMIEGGLLFSNYDVTTVPQPNDPYSRVLRMEQRNYTLGVKYQFLNSRVRPTVGALLGYTTRSFIDPLFSRPNSQSYDAGLSVGADVIVSNNFSIGANVQYFMNLSSRIDQPPGSLAYPYNGGYAPYPCVAGGTNIDQINYYILSVSGVLRF